MSQITKKVQELFISVVAMYVKLGKTLIKHKKRKKYLIVVMRTGTLFQFLASQNVKQMLSPVLPCWY